MAAKNKIYIYIHLYLEDQILQSLGASLENTFNDFRYTVRLDGIIFFVHTRTIKVNVRPGLGPLKLVPARGACLAMPADLKFIIIQRIHHIRSTLKNTGNRTHTHTMQTRIHAWVLYFS